MLKMMLGIEVLFEGAEWPVATANDIIVFILAIIVIILSAFAGLRYYFDQKSKKDHARHLFLYKSKHSGLSNYHHSILSEIASISSHGNPALLFDSPVLFEKSIALFMDYVKGKGESPETLKNISRDIIIIHEKLYHQFNFREPIQSITEIEPGVLILIVSGDSVVIGKVIRVSPQTAVKTLSSTMKEDFQKQTPVQIFFWRSGDAEYTYQCEINSTAKNMLEITSDGVLERGNEVHHPFIAVFIPCILDPDETPEDTVGQRNEIISGTLIRMNEYELVARIKTPADYDKTYTLEFNILDNNLKAGIKILSAKSEFQENHIVITCKIIGLSNTAKRILKKYIAEHI